MEQQPALTLREWMKQVQVFKAGAAGYVVVALTLGVTAFFALNPELILPPGRYPRFVLMIPALAIGALVFVAASALTWSLRRPRS